MKRLILLPTMLLFVLASCDSPVNNLEQNRSASGPQIEVFNSIPDHFSPAQGDSVRKTIFQQFKAQNGPEWQIRWNKRTGLPASVFSGLSKKAYRGAPVQAARTFLSEYRALFGIADPDRLKHVKTRIHRGIRHVTFNQMAGSVPVYEAQYKVHLRPGGRVDMANGTYYPDMDISTRPSVSKSQAATTARSDLGIATGQDLQTTSELVVYPSKEQFHLAWKLILFSEDPSADWFYMVDAHSGTILEKQNRLAFTGAGEGIPTVEMHTKSNHTVSVTGDGDVYPAHPGLSSVSNRNFYRLDGNGKLQGTYANIVNDETSEAFSSSHSFQFAPDNTHFDEANLYYHIDRFRHNFIGILENGSLGFSKITAHAHTPLQDFDNDGFHEPNAWFCPNNGELFFNDEYSTAGSKDFAKEDKVIYHEYTHAVVHDIEDEILFENNEEGAVSEGIPDYFAGSFTGRTKILDYAIPFRERDMANPEIASYSEYLSEDNVPGHTGGEFLSAILWDLRSSALGSSLTDQLVFDAIFRLTDSPDFLELRDAMIASDNAAFNGDHAELIQNTFAYREVGSFVPPSVDIDAEAGMFQGETQTFTANVTKGEPPYSYQWYFRHESDPSFTLVPGATSSTYDHTAGAPPEEIIRVVVTDARTSMGEGQMSIFIFGQSF